MTQKELLYFEDAIGHEKNIISILTETIKMVTSEEIKSFLEAEIDVHNSLLSNLTTTMEGIVNE